MGEFTEALFSIFFVETLDQRHSVTRRRPRTCSRLDLNLIFGVIDVVWICYAEIIMLGMYTIYFLHVEGGIAPSCPWQALGGIAVTVDTWVWLTHQDRDRANTVERSTDQPTSCDGRAAVLLSGC